MLRPCAMLLLKGLNKLIVDKYKLLLIKMPAKHINVNGLVLNSLSVTDASYDFARLVRLPLTWVHQPVPNGLSHIKCDPLCCTFGLDIFAINVAPA